MFQKIFAQYNPKNSLSDTTSLVDIEMRKMGLLELQERRELKLIIESFEANFQPLIIKYNRKEMDRSFLLFNVTIQEFYQSEFRRPLAPKTKFQIFFEIFVQKLEKQLKEGFIKHTSLQLKDILDKAKKISIKGCSWKEKKRRVLKKLLKLLSKLRRLDVSLAEYIKHQPFGNGAYHRQDSNKFMMDVRLGKVRSVLKMLLVDKYLIYVQDAVTQILKF